MADLLKIENRKNRRRAKSAMEIEALLPKNRSYSYEKRHTGEPLGDFRKRRRASNRRRRLAEKNPLLFRKF